jgi:hypothetical protein
MVDRAGTGILYKYLHPLKHAIHIWIIKLKDFVVEAKMPIRRLCEFMLHELRIDWVMCIRARVPAGE